MHSPEKFGGILLMIRRRRFTAGAAAALLTPSISRGAAAAPLKFIPQSDLTILDPIVTTVYTARNHGYMVFDTLFGMNSQNRIEPQMAGRLLSRGRCKGLETDAA
jgi:peptide/nickel transport system substrate-binding protein